MDFPSDQTCCVQPNFNAGLRAEALPSAEHTIRVFERTNGDNVTLSGSYAQIFKEREIQAQTHKEFSQKYGGDVFYIISIKEDGKKIIKNTEVIENIKTEIRKLSGK